MNVMERVILKMRRLRNWSILLIMTVIFALSGCGKKIYDFAASDLAKDIYSNIGLQDTVSEVDKNTVMSQYELGESDFKDLCAYMSTGATTEEVAVFVCKDKKEAEAVKEKCELRIKRQSDIYASYAPEEVERLKNSYLEIKGNVVILCVSDEKESVAKLVDNFFKNK